MAEAGCEKNGTVDSQWKTIGQSVVKWKNIFRTLHVFLVQLTICASANQWFLQNRLRHFTFHGSVVGCFCDRNFALAHCWSGFSQVHFFLVLIPCLLCSLFCFFWHNIWLTCKCSSRRYGIEKTIVIGFLSGHGNLCAGFYPSWQTNACCIRFNFCLLNTTCALDVVGWVGFDVWVFMFRQYMGTKKNYWTVLYMFGFWWWLDLFLCYCFWRCTVLLRRIRKTRDPPLFCGRQLRNHHQVKRPICVATAFYYNSNFDRHLQMDDLPWLCLQAQNIDYID